MDCPSCKKETLQYDANRLILFCECGFIRSVKYQYTDSDKQKDLEVLDKLLKLEELAEQ